jgi:uncharacterized phage-associated protein
MSFPTGFTANNILQRAFAEQVPVSTMKLQKLLFFAACEYVRATGDPMLHEPFAAWEYGPVIPSLHRKFHSLGGSPISVFWKDAAGNARLIDEIKHPAVAESIDAVWGCGRNMSAVDLARLTHAPASAWHQTWLAGASWISSEAMFHDLTYCLRLGVLTLR